MRPVLRLFSVIALVLFMGLVGLQFLRWMGMHEASFTSNHPWMKKPLWLAARLDPKQCSQAGLKDLLTLDKEWLIWIDLQPDKNQVLRLVCPSGEVFDEASSAPGPALSDLPREIKRRGVIFNLRAPDATFSKGVLKPLRDWAGEKTDIGLASPSQSLIRDLRKQEPDWLFAADSSTWSKLKIFAAFGIESTVDLWPDFFIASINTDDANSFSIKTAREIQRRQKVLLLEWDGQTVPQEWKKYLRGILTTRPKNFRADTFFQEMGAK